ncbi:japanin-like-RA2 isoform X1 [Rhipicephalus microplus]|uniref:japanin-like-RA2 isoform X1 n=1 Tax=Rhipicephalus microplus TaxID=6941 RepID=UPI003F6BA930
MCAHLHLLPEKMRLHLLHVLLTYGFMFTIYASEETALNSYFCSDPKGTPLKSNFCPVVKGPGTLCVEHASNPMLCRNDARLQVIGEPIDKNKSLKYPLPASHNTLYLVGYSEELKRPEYSCIASSFSRFGEGYIHRYLLLKKVESKERWDEKIPIQLQATLCSIRMNLTVTCELAKKTGAQRQYLMFYQTWNTMLLTELIQHIEKPLLCSLWAKYDSVEHVDNSTMSYFRGVCQKPIYSGYPKECPKEKN